MADDQSEVSGMMQMAGDDDVSEANLVNDLGGKATRAPVIKQRASDDLAHDLSAITGSKGNDFFTAK